MIATGPSDADAPSVLVTGASRGIGRAVATALARDGHRVALVARSADRLAEVATGIRDAGGSCTWFAGDVRSAEQMAAAVASAVAEFGRLDGTLVNAGITVDVPAHDLTAGDFRDVVDVNLTGSFLTAQAAASAMRRRGGQIVFVTSTFAHVAGPNRAAYTASKAGIAGLVRSLAFEWAAERIRVNAVAPTACRTDLNRAVLDDPDTLAAITSRIPLGRILAPEDLVGAVQFLLGPGSAMITGQTVLVDGGWTIH